MGVPGADKYLTLGIDLQARNLTVNRRHSLLGICPNVSVPRINR